MTVREIEPRSGVAFPLRQGQRLRVIDPKGVQVSDLLAFAAADVREAISNGRTFDYEETIALTTGNRLWSNRSNPMLAIVEDTVGRHDFLLTPCSEATFRHFYPDQPAHRGCFGNLAEALEPYGVEPDMIPCAFKQFKNRGGGPAGRSLGGGRAPPFTHRVACPDELATQARAAREVKYGRYALLL